jgi:hypothetical protein
MLDDTGQVQHFRASRLCGSRPTGRSLDLSTIRFGIRQLNSSITLVLHTYRHSISSMDKALKEFRETAVDRRALYFRYRQRQLLALYSEPSVRAPIEASYIPMLPCQMA